MSAIGELNRRLVLQAPGESDDGAGGVARTFETVATLWAKVTPLSAVADVTADSLGPTLRAAIVIRKRDGITARHRLRDGERVYRIVAARESADRRFLEIDAEERGQ